MPCLPLCFISGHHHHTASSQFLALFVRKHSTCVIMDFPHVHHSNDVVQHWDVVWGTLYPLPENHYGNNLLWEMVVNHVQDAMFNPNAEHLWSYDIGYAEKMQGIRKPKNSVCKFYFAISSEEVCELPDQDIATCMRQTVADANEAILLGPMGDRSVLNYLEVRYIWLNKFPRGSIQRIFLRLFDEMPARLPDFEMLMIVNGATPEEAFNLFIQNRNYYNMVGDDEGNRLVILNDFETIQEFDPMEFPISPSLSEEINEYIDDIGFNAYPIFPLDPPEGPPLNGIKLLFGWLNKHQVPSQVFDNITISQWLNQMELGGTYPFVPPQQGTDNMVTGLRKCLTSFVRRPFRNQGGHFLYKGTDVPFPNYEEMAFQQMHSVETANKHYLFRIRQILNFH